MLQVRGFLAVAPEEKLLGLLALLPGSLEYPLLPKWFMETSPEGPREKQLVFNLWKLSMWDTEVQISR